MRASFLPPFLPVSRSSNDSLTRLIYHWVRCGQNFLVPTPCIRNKNSFIEYIHIQLFFEFTKSWVIKIISKFDKLNKIRKKHMLKISGVYLIGKAEIPIHYKAWATVEQPLLIKPNLTALFDPDQSFWRRVYKMTKNGLMIIFILLKSLYNEESTKFKNFSANANMIIISS